MATPRKILVVDDDDHTRFLLTKTLLRRFPQLVMLECIQGSSALTTVAFEQLDLVIVRRGEDMSGLDLVGSLRRVAPALPSILVTAGDRMEAIAAGATRCLNVEDWLQVGLIASDLVSEKARSCA